jgi:anti-sigma factor RsiW
MTTSTHPEDLELFELVEGDLDGVRAAEVAAHVEGCAHCAEQVRLLETGRAALRDSLLLHLPPKRKKRLLAELPPQPRERRSPAMSPKRLLAVLTPIAATVAIVAVVTSTTGGGSAPEQSAAPKAAAEQARASEDSAAGGAGAASPPPAQAGSPSLESSAPAEPVARVAGTPERVARDLRAAGFDVTVSEGRVEVTGADPAAVAKALAGREAGEVAVYVR